MPLLHDVSELVREQLAAARAAGRVLTGREDDVRAGSVGRGIDGASRCRGALVGVNTNVAEVVAEAAFEVGASLTIERRSRRAQHVVNNRRRRVATEPLVAAIPRRSLQARAVFLLLAFVAGATVRVVAAGALALEDRRDRSRRKGNRGRTMKRAVHGEPVTSHDNLMRGRPQTSKRRRRHAAEPGLRRIADERLLEPIELHIRDRNQQQREEEAQ